MVHQLLSDLEKEGKSYVIEGFPRTKIQAIELQQMKIIPDKFFVLNMKDKEIYKNIKDKVTHNCPNLSRNEIITKTENAFNEYSM